MIGFNLNAFRSVLEANGGLVPGNRFQVEFSKPRGMTSGNSDLLTFYCKSAPHTGIGIQTSDVFRYGVGTLERKPYGTAFNDALMQFYVDGDGQVRKFFRNWIKLIINPDSRNGMLGVNRNGASPYELSYKEDYAVDITTTSFTAEGKPAVRTHLIEAYPNFIGDITQDWSDKNSLMIMTVAFTYRDWYESTVD